MFVKTSLNGNNSGSCEAYAFYITKSSSVKKVFNSKMEYVKVEDAILHIDQHAKGGIRSQEAKWYSPVYSLSQDESIHLANKILDYGTCASRGISKYDDLTPEEQEKYDLEVQKLAVRFQRQMAKNFNKSFLGINDEHDILWYASIEHARKYKGFDDAVVKKEKYQGMKKEGFNTHIHIIQSRKGLNEKKSLLSPQANARSLTKQLVGFDRNRFYNVIEQQFDMFAQYNRKITETFEYFKARKKAEDSPIENKLQYKTNFIQKNDIQKIVDNTSCINYFDKLCVQGKLQKVILHEPTSYQIYQDKAHNEYVVMDKYWYKNDGGYTRGGIIKAVQSFENLEWLPALEQLRKDYNQKFEVPTTALVERYIDPSKIKEVREGFVVKEKSTQKLFIIQKLRKNNLRTGQYQLTLVERSGLKQRESEVRKISVLDENQMKKDYVFLTLDEKEVIEFSKFYSRDFFHLDETSKLNKEKTIEIKPTEKPPIQVEKSKYTEIRRGVSFVAKSSDEVFILLSIEQKNGKYHAILRPKTWDPSAGESLDVSLIYEKRAELAHRYDVIGFDNKPIDLSIEEPKPIVEPTESVLNNTSDNTFVGDSSEEKAAQSTSTFTGGGEKQSEEKQQSQEHTQEQKPTKAQKPTQTTQEKPKQNTDNKPKFRFRR
ncbi:DUF5712 family protein [Ornithobacterium rhinotracheale]|uniref:DUF5712 family protein n=1 Tax=Ornithobacterium rhinotracheale TaxID=28251 RepID=UPI003FA41008